MILNLKKLKELEAKLDQILLEKIIFDFPIKNYSNVNFSKLKRLKRFRRTVDFF